MCDVFAYQGTVHCGFLFDQEQKKAELRSLFLRKLIFVVVTALSGVSSCSDRWYLRFHCDVQTPQWSNLSWTSNRKQAPEVLQVMSERQLTFQRQRRKMFFQFSSFQLCHLFDEHMSRFLEPLLHWFRGCSTNILDIPSTQDISLNILQGCRDLWDFTRVILR